MNELVSPKLMASVLATMEAEVAPATRKAYAQALDLMSERYEQNGWDVYPERNGSLDLSRFTEQVLSYLQSQADAGRSYSTLNKTLAALKYQASYTNPIASGALVSRPVKAFMEGFARNTREREVRKAKAFTVDELRKLYGSIKPTSVRNVRDRALISLGIATALRSQNLAALKLSDVSTAVHIDGVLIRVRFSKTDQRGAGHFVPVAKAGEKKVDPVRMLREWLAVLALHGYTPETTPDFPLFPSVRGQRGIQPHPIQHPAITITALLRSRLEALGWGAERAEGYSSHSLRSTFITLSSQAGVNEASIAAVSGHKSMTTLRSYDRSSVERFAQADYLSSS